MHVVPDSTGESGSTGADAASNVGWRSPEQAAMHKVPQECSCLLQHAGEGSTSYSAIGYLLSTCTNHATS